MFEVKNVTSKIYTDVIYPKIRATFYRTFILNGKFRGIDNHGEANCDKDDKFNEKFGIELARTRAEINMLKEYEKLLISLTKQPEWRKEKPKYEVIVEPDSRDFGNTPEKVNIFNNSKDKKIKVTVEVL